MNELDLLSPTLRARAAELSGRFRDAAPFPHLIVDEFFEPSFCAQLIAEFPPFERAFSLGEEGRPGNKAVVENLRALGGAYARADDLFRSPAFAEWMSALTGIPELLYDPDYMGGGTHENRTGADLDPHVDFNYHPRHEWHRRLNLIIYLNREWRDEWGGALELHSDPWLPPEENRVERVLPLANRAVVFATSERSWHGVDRVSPPPDRALTRKSLALYMYTKQRPAEETAPDHQTVYVDRPLPFALEPGRRVSFAEYSRLNEMLHRRVQRLERLARREFSLTVEVFDLLGAVLAGGPVTEELRAMVNELFAREGELLRALYEREKSWTRDQAKLARARKHHPRFGLLLFGPVEVAGAPVDFHAHDGWCGPWLRIPLRADAAITRLTIEGFVPEQIGAQTLTLELDGRAHERALTFGRFVWEVPVSLAAGRDAVLSVRAKVAVVPSRDLPPSKDERALSFMLRGLELS